MEAVKMNYFKEQDVNRRPKQPKGQPMKTMNMFLVAAGLLLGADGAFAQFAKAEDAIKYRKNALFVMQQHYARLGAMVTGKRPYDGQQAQEDVAIAEYLSALPWAAFGEGTDLGDTKAKPQLWQEQAQFKQLAGKMQDEMKKLKAAVNAGDLEKIKLAFKATSGTCKSCHDDYRMK